MSSFRIDRQYVSFSTTETKAVYSPISRQETKSRDSRADDRNPEGETSHDRELNRQVREAAEQQAALILEQAKADADALVRSAGQQADQLLEGTAAKAAEIREAARADGYEQGRTRAQEEAKKQRQSDAAALAGLEEQLRSAYATLVNDMQGDVVALVMNIVKKVIGIKLAQSDEAFMGLVRSALDQLKHNGTAAIRVSAEDYARYFGAAPAGTTVRIGKTEAAVMEGEGYTSGDLVVESEYELLDMSIGKQMDRIEAAFLQEGTEGPDGYQL